MRDIPELKLSTLTKLIQRFMQSPKLLLLKLFGEDNWPSDEIEWEAQTGDRGLTPFSNEDVEAPRLAPIGVATHKAMSAFWKEKMYFGSSFLNNIREPGTKQTYYAAKKYLAQQMQMLRNRCDRRKEWMVAQMLTEGTITYVDPNQKTISVDYGARKWDQDTANIVEDIMDAKLTMENANSSEIDFALFTTEVLKEMVLNPTIQTLLSKSNYGQGDLFARPTQVLGDLLNIKNMVLYNQMYQVRGWLTSALAAGAGSHTVYVDDVTNFVVGATIYVRDVSANTKESLTITAKSESSGTLTATGTLDSSYKAGEDCVTMTRKFIPTDKFCMFSSEVEGQKIAEFAKAPFGLDRHYGMKLDRWEKKDPDGIFIRVENKGLPVLYFEDAVFIYTVL